MYKLQAIIIKTANNIKKFIHSGLKISAEGNISFLIETRKENYNLISATISTVPWTTPQMLVCYCFSRPGRAWSTSTIFEDVLGSYGFLLLAACCF